MSNNQENPKELSVELDRELACWESDVAAALRALRLAVENDFAEMTADLAQGLRDVYTLLLKALLIAPEGEPRRRVGALLRRLDAGLAMTNSPPAAA
jgi:hypothetical protein